MSETIAAAASACTITEVKAPMTTPVRKSRAKKIPVTAPVVNEVAASISDNESVTSGNETDSSDLEPDPQPIGEVNICFASRFNCIYVLYISYNSHCHI